MVPQFRQEHEFQIKSRSGKTHAPRAKIVQFPMRLSWANTAHKMQGQTVKKDSKLIVHWNKHFQHGMAYVMLGRCESINDLYISGNFDPALIKCSPDALEEAKRISKLIKDRSFLEAQLNQSCLKISYLNIRSFVPHIEDLKRLQTFMKSDVFGLGEIWTDSNF